MGSMPARVSSSYVIPDHLQIILRDPHCEQCLGISRDDLEEIKNEMASTRS